MSYDNSCVCLSKFHSVSCLILVFFFFKQKTAYEVRISDWSSDVCSSDLSGDGSNPGGDDNGDSNQSDTATQLGEMLNGFDPGALFNDEIATQINEGNFEGFQERFTNSMRASMRQTMTMSATLMRAYGDRLLEQVRGEMQGMFEGRDDQSQLTKDFPAAADPTVGPMIQSVFNQALKNTEGDRTKAVAQTKKMISLMPRRKLGRASVREGMCQHV